MRIVERVLHQKALGGPIEVGIVADESFDSDAFLKVCFREVLLFEKNYSRFLPSSRLSRLNATGRMRLTTDDEFRDLLHTAKVLMRRTEGLFNPFTLPALQRAGYLGSSDEAYHEDQTLDYRQRGDAGIADLAIDGDEVRIPFGTALDLGGCGKGYLADLLMQRMRSETRIVGGWTNLSGDIAAFGHDAEKRDVTIAIQQADATVHPTTITVSHAGVGIATSGTLHRENQTIQGHHIIDPRTSTPATTDIILATVVARTAVEADVFASCAVIVGSKEAPRLLVSLGVDGYLLQYRDGNNVRMISEGNMISAKEGQYA